jgi:A/G-specific DNA glycosylase
MQKDSQVKAIINWYQLNKRKLPFRFSRDPYKIWLSEIMLQQTQVITMCPYYIKWIKKYPNIKSVLSVPYEIILKSWEGLGYYSRCKNFYDALKIVDNVYRGIVPKDYKKFSELPGVGEYTASAVLSIAYNKKYFVIDGNVKRVFSRYLGIKKLTRYNVSRIKNYLNNLIQLTNSGVFNQSIMEIGAILCKKNDTINVINAL